ncbi:MAG: dTDP-glucose 4,6-dehydratase [Planctomycetota bacterium]|nr:dTDP-glucose 4,6-dehydratase [Planctomycetota bacterium]
MPEILVTGGAGFIGVNLVRWWRRNRPADGLVVLDSLTYAGNLMSLEGIEGIEFVKGDIRDTELVTGLLSGGGISGIVHLAAESHVDRSIEGPDSFIETNVLGTHSLLKAARRAWRKDRGWIPHRFLHVSTDEVYGSLAEGERPFDERTRYAPNSPYSASKAGSDHLVRAYRETYGLETITTNCTNNYGPYQFPEKLIPLMVVNALEGRELPVYGDGSNVRDWLHVSDHCRGLASCMDDGRPGETYCMGGGNEVTNIDVVRSVCAVIQERFEGSTMLRDRFPGCPAATGGSVEALIRFVRDRPGHDGRYAVDGTKASEQVGFIPEITFETGLESTVNWYLENDSWWRAVLDGSYRDWITLNYGDRDARGPSSPGDGDTRS